MLYEALPSLERAVVPPPVRGVAPPSGQRTTRSPVRNVNIL